MRTEIYEQYKQEHPEELHEVRTVYGYSQAIEAKRAFAREDKIRKIARWKAILDAENREER